jgi:hypothetical protein
LVFRELGRPEHQPERWGSVCTDIIAPMTDTTRGPVIEAVERLLPRVKYPWLFVILAAMFVLDLFIPDPIPILDEATLALLTILVGGWRTRRARSTASEPTPAQPESGSETDVGDAQGP